jgi:hypothetical protein
MAQVLHGSATTTEAVRRAIQHSQESLRALARRYSINQKTVAKWKGRSSVADRPTGAKVYGSVYRGGLHLSISDARLPQSSRPRHCRRTDCFPVYAASDPERELAAIRPVRPLAQAAYTWSEERPLHAGEASSGEMAPGVGVVQ